MKSLTGSRLFAGLFALLFGLQLALLPHRAYAEAPPISTAGATPSATPSGGPSVSLSEFNAICGDILKREQALKAAGRTSEEADGQVASQKAQYCTAAQSSMNSFNAHDALWKVWTAVTGVCTAVCVASFFGLGSAHICTGVNLAAGIADSAVTQNFQGALMSIGSTAAMLGSNWAMRKATSQTGTTAAAMAGKSLGGKIKSGLTNAEKDIGSCISAAMAGVQIYTNVAGSQSDNKMATDTLAAAKKLNQNSVNAFDPTGGNRGPELETTTMGSNVLGSAGSAARGGAMTEVAGSYFAGGGACGGPGAGPESGASILSCALASDSTLPPSVTSPEFQQAFKDVSGTDLGKFLENANNPTQALGAASADAMPPEQASQFAEAVQGLEAGVMAQQEEFLAVNEATYSGGGGGKKSDSGDPFDKSLTDMMATLMGTMLPKNGAGDKDPKKSASMAAVIFANSRKPSSVIPEDKKLNLFDRITYRYFFVSNRVLTETAFPGNPGQKPATAPMVR